MFHQKRLGGDVIIILDAHRDCYVLQYKVVKRHTVDISLTLPTDAAEQEQDQQE